MVYIKKIALVAIALFICPKGFNQLNINSDVAIYEFSPPDKKNYDESPRVINWLDGKKNHFIQFGKFTTETTWEIFDQMEYDGRDSEKPVPIIKINFEPETIVIIEITKFKKGKYYINYTAIAAGCRFEMHIK